MRLWSTRYWQVGWCLGVVFALGTLTGCDNSGNLTEERATVADRSLSAVAQPGNTSQVRPVQRVPRDRFGTVGAFPLTTADMDHFVYPDANAEERQAITEGLTFFTTPHTPQEGAGPAANQVFCLGCHLSSDDVINPGSDRLGTDENGNRIVSVVSHVSRAARTTPTNFDFTSFDPLTGAGRAADNDDAVTNTGRTAAFTIFGDFSPASGLFDGLTQFGGFVQHTRPSLAACVPDPIIPPELDPNLRGGIDPVTGVSALGFRRAVGERAGPPYIGRGLMEAIFDADIIAQDDDNDARAGRSSLDTSAIRFPECRGDCISGRHNENTSNQSFIGGDPLQRLGRFGLRAAGPTILQFVFGGFQGELGFTSVLGLNEINNEANVGRPGCVDTVGEPEFPLSALISCRALLRMTAPPEFGTPLLNILNASDPNATRADAFERSVQRGAQLFGLDLVAFANRMIPGRMPAGGDNRDANAINQTDRLVDCAGCHTPVHRTGESPAEVGARHLSNVWAPIFSDLLLHQGPTINGERIAPAPRLPLVIQRVDSRGRLFNTFDLPRNLSDDSLPNQGLANGTEFRTPPLMGMGRMGPPFFHDARVYLSRRSVNGNTTGSFPAGTVFTNSQVTNAPLVVRTLDDAIRAVIELHDLPPPDDSRTPSLQGAGCPVPPDGSNRVGDVVYFNVNNPFPGDGSDRARATAEICPPYTSPPSQINRSEARLVIRRYRSLSPEDQQSLINFLKQL